MTTLPRLLLGLAPFVSAAAPQEPGSVSFQREVLPILRSNCQGCHQPAKSKGDIVLTSHAAITAGGAVVPGDGAASLLLEVVTAHDGEPPEMPKDADPLGAQELAILERWIAEGARDDSPATPAFDAARPPTYARAPVVTSVAYSPDGTRIAVAGRHEVLVHSGDGAEIVSRLVGLSERVESIAFSPDGARLAVVGGVPGLSGEVQVWDVAESRLQLSVPVSYDVLHGVSWSPDGTRVAFGCPDRTLRVLDAQSGEEVLFQGAHEDWVLGTAWSTDGSHLVSVSRDRSMKLVKVSTQQFIDNITSITPGALKGGLMSVARHPTRDELLVGGADGEPKVYRMYREKKRVIGDDYNLIRAFEPLRGRVFSVDWSTDGELVVAGSSAAGAGQVRVSRAADGSSVWTRELDSGVYAVDFHPDGTTVVAAGFDGRVRTFAASDGAPVAEFTAVPLTEAEER